MKAYNIFTGANPKGWAVLKGLRKVGIRIKGDEHILGDSDFVENRT